MAKLSTPDLESGYRSVEKLTEFITDVGTALDNTVSRDGSSPNQMLASLDMNSNHILNLPAPTLPGDPIRLQDLTPGATVETSTTVTWDAILGKPTTFPPGPTTVSNITDFGVETQQLIGTSIIPGTNVAVSYNSGTGFTTISATAPPSGSVAYVDITGKPATFPPDAHTHNESEIVSLVSDLAAKASTASLTAGLATKSSLGHTHTSADITDFTEASQDAVAGALVAGSGMSIAYNDSLNTITFSSSSGASLPHGYTPAYENSITTANGAGTNTSNLNGLISTLNAAGGGTIWFNDPGAYQINGTINFKSNVSLVMASGAYFQWTGSSGGTIFGSATSDVLYGHQTNITVNEGSSFSGIVFDLHSAQGNNFRITALGTQTSSGVFAHLFADSTAGLSPFAGLFANRNLASNTFYLRHLGTCGSGIIMSGITSGYGGSPQGATNNTFFDTVLANVITRGIKINEWSDSNSFPGYTYIGLSSGANSIGIIINEGRTNNGTVYNTTWEHLAIDIFGSLGNRYGVVFQESKGMSILEMLTGPTLESGDFVGTNCTSYYVKKLVNTGSSVTGSGLDSIYVHQKALSTGL